MATTVDRTDQAAQLLSQIDKELALLDKHPLTNQRVAFLFSMDPSKLRLTGTGTSGEAFIDLTQAQNVADFNNYQNVSSESLLALAPDIIIVAGSDPKNAVQR